MTPEQLAWIKQRREQIAALRAEYAQLASRYAAMQGQRFGEAQQAFGEGAAPAGLLCQAGTLSTGFSFHLAIISYTSCRQDQ